MEGSNDGTSVVEGFSLGCSDGTEDIDGCSDGCAEILGEDVLLDLLDFADVVVGGDGDFVGDFVDFDAVLPIMAAEYCS